MSRSFIMYSWCACCQKFVGEVEPRNDAESLCINDEREFSFLVDEILGEIKKARASRVPNRAEEKTQVLIACAEGNYHDFGARLICEFLNNEKFIATCKYPSAPFDEIFTQALEENVPVLGISVATREQEIAVLDHWTQYCKEYATMPAFQLIIGGVGVSVTPNLPPGAYLDPGNLNELKDLVRKLIKQTGPAPITSKNQWPGPKR